jgi:hypothetical protein
MCKREQSFRMKCHRCRVDMSYDYRLDDLFRLFIWSFFIDAFAAPFLTPFIIPLNSPTALAFLRRFSRFPSNGTKAYLECHNRTARMRKLVTKVFRAWVSSIKKAYGFFMLCPKHIQDGQAALHCTQHRSEKGRAGRV